jgi:nucleoside-diphosphate-sugar epimerase
MDNLNIFITGGTTALGREATRQLASRGHKVTALTTGSDGAAKVRKDGGLPGFSDPFRSGDIRSLLIMSKADVILHLMPQIPNNFPHRDSGWEANKRVLTEGTEAVLQAAHETGVKFIVFASYALLYGDTHGEPVTEESELHGSKAFQPAYNAENRFLDGTVPGCVLRSALVYGAGDTGTEALKDALQNGRSLYLGNGHNIQSWIHASDLARAAVLAAEQQPNGQIFNVADDRPATPAQFAKQLATGLGVFAPTNLSGFGLRRMTTDFQREMIDLSQQVKSDKARSTLGWSPKYPDLTAGIEQTLLYWRAGNPVQA